MAPRLLLGGCLLVLAMTLGLAAAGAAQDAALVIGNETYADGTRVEQGAAPVAAAEALTEAGIDTLGVRDADADQIRRQLRQFEQFTRSADGLLIVLSGRFVRSDDETWFLPVGTEGDALVETAITGLPLSLALTLLGEVPGRAVLALAADETARGRISRSLREGIGALDVPQGVTVLRGSPGAIAGMIRDTLAVPGASIRAAARRSDDVRATGFLTPRLAFLPGRRAAGPDGDEGGPGGAPEDRAEATLWGLTVDRDDVESFEAYLNRYPQGPHADQARRRIDAIRDEPNRAARIIEDNLDLGLDRRREIQRDLSLLGHDTRGIDGIFGPGTRNAIGGWQRANSKAATGFLDLGQIRMIDGQASRRAAKLEEEERRRREAMRRAEETLWQQTGAGGTADGLERFLSRYPDGAYADRAEQRLRQIEDAEIGEEGISERERRLWRQARDAGSRAAYETYTGAYPEGRYADRARQALADIADRQRSATANAEARTSEQALGLNPVTRRAVEQRLQALDLQPGEVDGSFDDRTRRAVRRYQQSADLPVSGYLDQMTVVRLLADSLREALQ